LTDNPFSRFVSFREFGAMQNPPRSERSVRRAVATPDGLPYIDTPFGPRIDLDIAADYYRKRVRQSAPRRQGRAR
jgi:hypothetical protein